MKYILSIIIISLLASCKTGKNAMKEDHTTLLKKWELSSINGNTVNEENPIFLNFTADKTVNGKLGCNSVNGSYSIKGNTINFTQLASTRKACMDMSVEQSLLAVLNTADNFKFENGKLILSVNEIEVATFSEMIEAEITNKYWKITELNGNPVVMTENQEREQFVIFTNEGVVSGFSGCNHFNGFYTLSEGNKILVDDKISSTLKSCPDVEVDESVFLQALTAGIRFKINGEKMELFSKDKLKLAVFELVYF